MNQKNKMKGKVQWCTKAQQKLQTERIAWLEREREVRPPAAEDERPAAPLQDVIVGRGPPRAEAAR